MTLMSSFQLKNFYGSMPHLLHNDRQTRGVQCVGCASVRLRSVLMCSKDMGLILLDWITALQYPVTHSQGKPLLLPRRALTKNQIKNNDKKLYTVPTGLCSINRNHWNTSNTYRKLILIYFKGTSFATERSTF